MPSIFKTGFRGWQDGHGDKPEDPSEPWNPYGRKRMNSLKLSFDLCVHMHCGEWAHIHTCNETNKQTNKKGSDWREPVWGFSCRKGLRPLTLVTLLNWFFLSLTL